MDENCGFDGDNHGLFYRCTTVSKSNQHMPMGVQALSVTHIMLEEVLQTAGIQYAHMADRMIVLLVPLTRECVAFSILAC